MPLSFRDRAADFGLTQAEFDLVITALGREPNELETAVFGALWSEHCSYKNTRPLLATLPVSGPQVLQGPGENAGVVDIGDGLGAAFKVESHNHPSALAPYAGAATGVGGLLRDIFAMGARPLAVLDSLRFGLPDSARNIELLTGVLAGAGDYANGMGLPVAGGEIGFAPCYDENPLVNVMAIGLLKHEELQRGTVGEPGTLLVYAGAPTGREGTGGAVSSSADLDAGVAGRADNVPHGNPELERRVMEATLKAMGKGLLVGVQDMGAAGLSSSSAEMAFRAGHGADLWLDRIPLAEPGVSPLEMMLSETQERMLFAVDPANGERVLELLATFNVPAAIVGTSTSSGHLRLLQGGRVLADLPVTALNEAPVHVREGIEDPAITALREQVIAVPDVKDAAAELLQLLGSANIAARTPLLAGLDSGLQAGLLAAPGVADAALIRIPDSDRVIAASIDCNARYCYLDPREGARNAVAEAARNVAVTGGQPLGATNNLNFGNPTRPEVYWQLQEAVAGLSEACLALNTPITGGNVSLYNEYRKTEADGEPGGTIAIWPTPTVGVVGVLADADAFATSTLKRPGDTLLLLGAQTGLLGGSEYLAVVHDTVAGQPPRVDLQLEGLLQRALISLISSGLVDTAHDTAEGGLAVALAEMAAPAATGLTAVLPAAGAAAETLFGEAASRVVIAVKPGQLARVQEELDAVGLPWTALGSSGGDDLHLDYGSGSLTLPVAQVREAFEALFLNLVV
jgi:phosphoribosylformylglycinamidine synthase